MRIIAGSCRGRSLVTPKTRQIRPTTDRVKQVIFDSLGVPFDFPAALDLFAGTGSLGFEAISRGSESVIFVEKARPALEIIKKNAQNLQFQNQCKILPFDVFKALKQLSDLEEKFSLIFADPPYQKMLAAKIIDAIDREQLLLPGGIAIIEHSAKDTPNTDFLENLQIVKTKSLGETSFSLITHR